MKFKTIIYPFLLLFEAWVLLEIIKGYLNFQWIKELLFISWVFFVVFPSLVFVITNYLIIRFYMFPELKRAIQ